MIQIVKTTVERQEDKPFVEIGLYTVSDINHPALRLLLHLDTACSLSNAIDHAHQDLRAELISNGQLHRHADGWVPAVIPILDDPGDRPPA